MAYWQTMKIFEFSGKNTIREIDCLSQRIDLGSETYATGTLSREKIDDLCRTLLNFKEVMKTYQVDAFRAYGTSAIRETKNTLIVLDQIHMAFYCAGRHRHWGRRGPPR